MPRRKPQDLAFSDLLANTEKLSKAEMRKLITNYLKNNGGEMDERYERLVLTDLEKHLKELDINSFCPYCGSKIIKHNGKRNGIQRMKCLDCGKSFTYFTGTNLEKTKFHWDLWIELVYQMIKETSLIDIKTGLIDDNYTSFISQKTIYMWQRKILNAVEQMEQPELHGVIQIDETHYHESQKGIKEANMVSVFPGITRKARHHYRPAKYGPMGSEFTNVITAMDKSGHCVGKVVGLGKFTTLQFIQLFRDHIKDCSWLCTDNNNVYSKYCDDYNVPHYIRTSDYLEKTLGKEADELEKMFKNNDLDYVQHRILTYTEIEKLKATYGLNLGLVNELHKDIRTFINKNKHGVSSKHLNSWIAWIVLLKNYAVDYGHAPASKKDAEEIFKMILKSKTNITIKDLTGKKLNLPKPSDKDLLRLKKNTDKGRQLSGRKKFVFTEEDLIDDTAVRDIMYKMPLYLFKKVCKHYFDINRNKYKNYSPYLKTGKRFNYVQLLGTEKDIKEQLLRITAENGKTIWTSEEDPGKRQKSPFDPYDYDDD